MPAGVDGVCKNFLRRPLREAEGLLRRQFDALGDVLYALTTVEIKIVEGN
jgi:hypothetical protein